MERIRALINKLQQQSEQNAGIAQIAQTVQMLQSELAQSSAPVQKQMSSSNVAVMLPSSNKTSFAVREAVAEAPKKTEYIEPQRIIVEPIKKPFEKALQPAEYKTQEPSGWLFDPIEELVPTLAHQKNPDHRERNDVFGGSKASLNDSLKPEKKELASILTEGAVRDLKKAIGINDRFVFLNELFRGDETMYERSLKTINNFRIFPEAEYWIERELKVKLGWDEDKEAVKHFRHLVRRRFLEHV